MCGIASIASWETFYSAYHLSITILDIIIAILASATVTIQTINTALWTFYAFIIYNLEPSITT